MDTTGAPQETEESLAAMHAAYEENDQAEYAEFMAELDERDAARAVEEQDQAAAVEGAVDLTLVSFGYLHGPAPEAELVVDMRRHFRDPHVSPELRELTAADERVTRAVLETDGVRELAAAILAAVAAYRSGPSGGVIRVAVGCAGGRHRSAVMVEHLAHHVRTHSVLAVEVEHRDMHRPVVDR